MSDSDSDVRGEERRFGERKHKLERMVVSSSDEGRRSMTYLKRSGTYPKTALLSMDIAWMLVRL